MAAKIRQGLIGLALFLALGVASSVFAGIPPRVANTTLTFPQEPPQAGFQLVEAFPGLKFDQPVVVCAPPGETNRLFVVERKGKIFVITNLAQPDKTLFLNISTNLHARYGEAGLLGMAFHPGYGTNRAFFIYRTVFTTSEGATNALHDQLSRFETRADNPNLADSDSERVFFAQLDSQEHHNAGDLQFGPDGYLYLGLGDDGPAYYDQSTHPHPIDKGMFGAIIRVDVDGRPGNLVPNPHPGYQTTNYWIPADNPYVGVTNYDGAPVDPAQVRTELFAIGFRNPLRLHFDVDTGELYCGDVGGEWREEVGVVTSGGNHGWPFVEGTLTHAHAPVGFVSMPPLIDYRHGGGTNNGNCVVGGIIYRGSQIPELQGKYLFADHTRGYVWVLHRDTNNPANNWKQWIAGVDGPNPCYFAYDPRDQEVLIANHFTGEIMKLVYTPPEAAPAFPQRLSDTGAFADLQLLTVAEGMVPYEVNVPFWSDNAIKSRWFSIPDPALQMGFAPTGAWAFPTGMVWMKHFELELETGNPVSRRRLETRFVVKHTNGVYGLTYRWDDAQTNATLVPSEGMDEAFVINEGGGILRTQMWRYPARSECITCHNSSAGYALGFDTTQLHREAGPPGGETNQILSLAAAGYFSNAVPDLTWVAALSHATNTVRPLQHRARSFLAANCSACHRDQFALDLYWFAQFHKRLDEMKVLNNRYVRPGDGAGSEVVRRVSTRNHRGMPPIGSSLISTNAVALLTEWVNALPVAPWCSGDIGPAPWEGSATVAGDAVTVSSAGEGVGAVSNSIHWVRRTLTGNGHLIARFVQSHGGGPEAVAGIMFGNSTNAGAPFAAVTLSAGENLTWLSRVTTNGPLEILPASPVATPIWLRLLRQAGGLSAMASSDGTNWTALGEAGIASGESLFAGLFSGGAAPGQFYTAEFDHVRLLTVALAAPVSGTSYSVGASVPLAAAVTWTGEPPDRIEFLAGGQVIAVATNAPWQAVWSNAVAGEHCIAARAVDSSGGTVVSAHSVVAINHLDSMAMFITNDVVSSGNWIGAYGSEGYALPGNVTDLSWFMGVSVTGTNRLWPAADELPGALQRADAPGRVAAVWATNGFLELSLNLADGDLHRVALYFFNPAVDDAASEVFVEIRDAATQTLLDARVADASPMGEYLIWRMLGDLRVRIYAFGAGMPTLAGVFLDPDPNLRPQVAVQLPNGGLACPLPGVVTLTATAEDPDGAVDRVDFFADGDKIGESTAAPWEFVWANATAGEHSVIARAVDNEGAPGLSEPATLIVQPAPTEATFLGVDTVTLGNWMGRYGDAGYMIAKYATNVPAAGTFSVQAGNEGAWGYFPNDPRMLQTFESNRIGAVWYDSYPDIVAKTQFADGDRHVVALYFLDYDSGSRSWTVEVRRAADDVVLDSRLVEQCIGGKYFVWIVRGPVKFVVRQRFDNNLLNAVFLGGPQLPFEVWRNLRLPSDSGLVGDSEADPDEDGLKNWMEFALGLDPAVADAADAMTVTLEDGHLVGRFRRSLWSTAMKVVPAVSFDLQTWHEGAPHVESLGVTTLGSSELETVRSAISLSETNSLFLRLQIIRP